MPKLLHGHFLVEEGLYAGGVVEADVGRLDLLVFGHNCRQFYDGFELADVAVEGGTAVISPALRLRS